MIPVGKTVAFSLTSEIGQFFVAKNTDLAHVRFLGFLFGFFFIVITF